MLSRIKKTFLSFFKLNKKTVPVLLFFIFLGTFLPFHFANAFIELLATAIFTIAFWKIILLVWSISTTFLTASSAFLAWVTSPWFLKIDYANNPFVLLGWTLLRDLANMFFILILVVIALATILRIREYEVKKTLPLLIIIILLINFTPVITGIIIDFFNILMRFFLGEGTGLDSAVWGLEAMVGGWRLAWEGLDWWDLEALLGALLMTLITPLLLIIYNFLASLVFFILGLLFIMRPIALMLLVILSPMAFLAYILPATRGFFTQWWNQFIAWCLVGVTAGFFLYLTDQLAYLVAWEGFGGLITGGDQFLQYAQEGDIGGVFLAFVPFFVILGFLILGFFFTISTSAAGASHVIGFGKGMGRWAGQALAVKAGVMAAKKYSGWAHGIAGAAQKASEKLEPSKEATGLKASFGRLAAKPFRYAERKAEELALHGETLRLKEEQKWEKRYKESGRTTEERLRGAESGTEEQQVGALLALISNFEADEALKRLGPKKIAEIYKSAKEENLHKPIESCYFQLHEEFKKLPGKFKMTDEDEKAAYERIIHNPDLIKNIHPESYKLEKMRELIVNKFRGRHISEAAKSSDEAVKQIEDIFENHIEKVGFEKFAEENPWAATWLANTGARGGVGFRDVIHLPEEELNEILRKARVALPPRKLEEIKEEIAIKRRQIEELERQPDLAREAIARRREAREELAKLERELELKEQEETEKPSEKPEELKTEIGKKLREREEEERRKMRERIEKLKKRGEGKK